MTKRSLRIAGHATSISLEAPFWNLLTQVAAQEGRSVAAQVEWIDRGRQGVNLSSAIRVFLLEWVMTHRVIMLGTETLETETMVHDTLQFGGTVRLPTAADPPIETQQDTQQDRS